MPITGVEICTNLDAHTNRLVLILTPQS